MGTHIHKFNSENAYNTARSTNYVEPWVSKTILTNGSRINYNKTEEEKLLDTPLTFEILSDGDIVWYAGSSNYSCKKTIEYKKNDGEWTTITSKHDSSATIPVISGDVVQFRGDNSYYCYNTSEYNNFTGTTATFNIKGNIMSLINSTNYSTLTTLTANETFRYIFSTCSTMLSAEKLVLPATTLTKYCYSSMFSGCTSLTKGPLTLPATVLVEKCYNAMFYNCQSLTHSPEFSATTLAEQCCDSMFQNCSSLTTTPNLPATTLYNYCYSSMFSGCTSLTEAPSLPAKTLVNYCYYRMFHGCTNLSKITCLATDISASNCTDSWVYNVASIGTFTKDANMTNWTSGSSGTPTNWTVVDA